MFALANDTDDLVAKWNQLSFRQKRLAQMKLDHGELRPSVKLMNLMVRDLHELATQTDPVPDGAAIYGLNLVRYLKNHPTFVEDDTLRLAKFESQMVIVREAQTTDVLQMSAEMGSMINDLKSSLTDKRIAALEALGADDSAIEELKKEQYRLQVRDLAKMRPDEVNPLEVVALQYLMKPTTGILSEETLLALEKAGFRNEDLLLLPAKVRVRAIQAIQQVQYVSKLNIEREGVNRFVFFYHGVDAPLDFSGRAVYDFAHIFKESTRTLTEVQIETIREIASTHELPDLIHVLSESRSIQSEIPTELKILPNDEVEDLVIHRTADFVKILRYERGGPDWLWQPLFFHLRDLPEPQLYAIFMEAIYPHFKYYGVRTLRLVFKPEYLTQITESLLKQKLEAHSVAEFLSYTLTPEEYDSFVSDLIARFQATPKASASILGYALSRIGAEHVKTLNALLAWAKLDHTAAFGGFNWISDSQISKRILENPEFENFVVNHLKTEIPRLKFNSDSRYLLIKYMKALNPITAQSLFQYISVAFAASGMQNEAFLLQLRYPEKYIEFKEPYTLEAYRNLYRSDLRREQWDARKLRLKKRCEEVYNSVKAIVRSRLH